MMRATSSFWRPRKTRKGKTRHQSLDLAGNGEDVTNVLIGYELRASHTVGKENTQKIESKHINLRT
jgi:hypothetical protein